MHDWVSLLRRAAILGVLRASGSAVGRRDSCRCDRNGRRVCALLCASDSKSGCTVMIGDLVMVSWLAEPRELMIYTLLRVLCRSYRPPGRFCCVFRKVALCVATRLTGTRGRGRQRLCFLSKRAREGSLPQQARRSLVVCNFTALSYNLLHHGGAAGPMTEKTQTHCSTQYPSKQNDCTLCVSAPRSLTIIPSSAPPVEAVEEQRIPCGHSLLDQQRERPRWPPPTSTLWRSFAPQSGKLANAYCRRIASSQPPGQLPELQSLRVLRVLPLRAAVKQQCSARVDGRHQKRRSTQSGLHVPTPMHLPGGRWEHMYG